MPDEELTLILKLRDEATAQMKSARGVIVAAGAAIGAAGFTAGEKWDTATKTIVSGTGATGEALEGLKGDYQAVAKYGDGAAAAVADLNTHLGFSGPKLQEVAEKALKMGADTSKVGESLGHIVSEGGDANAFLDVFHAALQSSGVEADRMQRQINKAIPRFEALGFSAEETAAHVIELANEYGHEGLIPALAESEKELRKGGDVLGDYSALALESAGSIEKSYEAAKTWRDSIKEVKNAALAYLGPAGDMVGAFGSAASGLALAGPQMLNWIKGIKLATAAQKLFNIAMRLNPIGLIVTALVLAGAAIWKFRDEIKAGFGQVIAFAKDLYVGVKTWLTDKLGAIFDGVKAKVDAVTGFFGNMKDKIVGNSIVPDMVDEIGTEFHRMGRVMETETKSAVGKAADLFSNFFGPSGEFSLTTILDGAKGLFQNALTNTLNMVPVVGPLLSQFAPALMSGIGKLAGKIWGGIKALFGGPDGIEMEGRAAASDARDAIASTLTDGQIKEAAGNMANAVHIAVRDAVLGSGGTLEMAERTATEMVKMLHTAEKQGTAAVEAAKQAIVAILDSVPKEITTTITTVHRDVYEGSGRSSDVFRPSQIDPNRAGASQPAIQVTAIVPRNAVTDVMLQNAPRRQALHGTA